jgi:3-deoxy-D-manno-octulosonate 8-phosphate phosphatase KdsC-like HAD superfamily phosphatase
MSKRIDFTKIKLIVWDFDGVFTNNKVYTDQNGIESVREICDLCRGI